MSLVSCNGRRAIVSAEIPRCDAPDPTPRAACFLPPAGSCDCHCHVFTATSQLLDRRVYTPPPATLTAYRTVLATLGLDRAVVVQPSVYGIDNNATLTAVAAGGSSFRAVVGVPPDVPAAEIRRLDAQGAVGARVNFLFSKPWSREGVAGLARRLADFNWHLQLLADVSDIDVESLVSELPVPVVFDHMGHVPSEKGVDDPGFRALLRLMERGRTWVKLSGAYRMTTETAPPYDDVAPFARALIAANPERCLWGSDWPHPHISVPMPNDGSLFSMLSDWAPDEMTREQILVRNPELLYRFVHEGSAHDRHRE